MNKGLAEKKKWIKRTEKRIAVLVAKKAKTFAMSRNFRKFFSTNIVKDSAQNPISTSDEEMTTTSPE